MLITKELNEIVGIAREEAMRTGCGAVESDHLILGMLRHADNDGCRLLLEKGVDLSDMKGCVESEYFRGAQVPYVEFENIVPSKEAQYTMNLAMLEATKRGEKAAGPRDLLLAVCKGPKSAAKTYLNALGVRLSDSQPVVQPMTPSPKVINIVVNRSKIYS